MDHYLKAGSSLERLRNEYDKHGTLTIAFDFDGTVHDYHNTGESYEQVRQLLRDLKSIGCKCICWTCYHDLGYVISFCKENDIPLDGVNSDGIALPWTSRKAFFNAVLDDRAGLYQVYRELRTLVDTIKSK